MDADVADNDVTDTHVDAETDTQTPPDSESDSTDPTNHPDSAQRNTPAKQLRLERGLGPVLAHV
ncbi:MAG: hypothetical protein ACI9MR_001687 [Myxococcota bacterium]|jgi:hypothetical protein